jgi:hypothetical protein
MKTVCPNCGFEDEGNFCSKCGAPLKQAGIDIKQPLQTLNEELWTERCPVCQSGKLAEMSQKKFFGLQTSTNLKCNNCNAVFTHDGNKYKLTDVTNKLFLIWQEYNKQSLTTQEWKRISYGGMSDEKQHEADMNEYMTDLKEGKVSIKFRIEGGSSSVILKEKEELQILLPGVALWEPRKVTTTVGGYGGPSFRIAKGVYWRVGAFGAESQSREELKELDRGKLSFTNKRLIFAGTKRISEINLAKIISIEPYSDGIAVRASGKSKIQYFVGINSKQISTTITINERSYQEPFTGLMLKYMIEGLIRR